MPIEYSVIKAAQPGVKGGGTYRYYPRIKNRRTITLKEVSNRISERCSFKNPDVYGVLMALVDEFPQLLMENYIIQLGELGSFTLHAGAVGSETAEEATETKFTKLKVVYRPAKDIRNRLKTAGYKKMN
jgi:predicted histone-like DNA-binding protein